MSARLRVLLLLVAPLAAYATAPWSGFVWDDHKVIEHGRLIGSLRNLPVLFGHDAMYNSDGGRFEARAAIDTYRPLTLSTITAVPLQGSATASPVTWRPQSVVSTWNGRSDPGGGMPRASR